MIHFATLYAALAAFFGWYASVEIHRYPVGPMPAAGIYVWPSIEAAQKAHDESWRDNIRKRTGSDPTIRYFDLFLLIDNEHERVTEWAADGEARELDTAAA